MARKRMISPELWDNQSFGELSMLAKVLFIGMISQADDDGKGVLSPQLLKSKIFPYDELRVADVDKALKEIGHNVSVANSADTDKAQEERGHKMSVIYYEIDGKQYYWFENWRKWQTINRPIPSKLPDPLFLDGVRGNIHSHEVFNDNSVNTHTQVNEYSRTIEVKKEKKEDTYVSKKESDEGRETFHLSAEESSLNENAGKKRKEFIPPTLEEVTAYAEERGRVDLAKKFFDYFEAGNWHDSEGKPVKAWKQKFITWEAHQPYPDTLPKCESRRPIKNIL